MKEISNIVDCRFGFQDMPIISGAALKGDIDVIKYLVDNRCDVRKTDKYGRTAWNMLFWERPESSDDEKNRLRIADILLTTFSNVVEAIFLEANNCKTPFLIARQEGFNTMILHFLDLIDTNSISIDHRIVVNNNNVFHYLLDNWHRSLSPTRLESLRALFDKFPNFLQLIDAKNDFEQTPLHYFFEGNKNENREAVDLTNLFFQCGASLDLQDGDGVTYLDYAIQAGNVSFIEILLRVGCRTDVSYYVSPLFFLLRRTNFISNTERLLAFGYTVSPLCSLLKNKRNNFIPIIERLLAFGCNLQKELLLYTINERPIEFTSPEYVVRRDTTNMDPDILQQLQELRRSNKMLSLQRQCRNTIRRHLKAKADEFIGSLTCIPDRIKSYLLVKNEEPLLEIRE